MEEKTIDVKNIGLRGVKVADTRISDVDGEKGILIYRGFNINDLVSYSTFEEVSFLLLNDRLPTKEELKGFQKILVSERDIPSAVLALMKKLPPSAHPMDVLQASLPILASYDPDPRRSLSLKRLARSRDASMMLNIRDEEMGR